MQGATTGRLASVERERERERERAGGDVHTNYSCHTSVLRTGILFTGRQSAVWSREVRVNEKKKKKKIPFLRLKYVYFIFI